ncbi:MAG: rhodanese-like domain-containing protein [Terrimesophilobacter sp.]
MELFGKLFSRPYQSVSVQGAQALLDDGAVLVDVRSNQEWNAGHAPAARHLVLETLHEHTGGLRHGTAIVTICRSGMRSASAARVLVAKGFSVATVKGGMFAWQRSGGRVVAKNGRDGVVM